MFFRLGFYSKSPIETLLENSATTLEDLLDEDDILQECKAHTDKLVQYMCKRGIIEKLIRYVITVPDNVDDMKKAHKFPLISCEILCCELGSMFDLIADEDYFMELVFSFFDCEAPLKPAMAHFFMRFFSLLQQRKGNEIMRYVQKHAELVERIARHVSTASVPEAILRLIGCDNTQTEPDPLTGGLFGQGSFPSLMMGFRGMDKKPVDKFDVGQVSQWWVDHGLISNLLTHFDPARDREAHINVAHLLSEIVRRPVMQTTTMYSQIVGEEFLGQVMDILIANPTSSVFQEGLSFIQAVLEGASASAWTPTSEMSELPSSLRAILSKLEGFLSFLATPPAVGPIQLTTTLLDPPLGSTRLRVAELVAGLLATRYEAVENHVAECKALPPIFDLFFQYDLHNLLHCAVDNILVFVLTSPSDTLKIQLLSPYEYDLPHKLIVAHRASLVEVKRKLRKGNLGHILRFLDRIDQTGASNHVVEKLLLDTMGWKEYVNSEMTEALSRERRTLGGQDPSVSRSSDEDDMFENSDPASYYGASSTINMGSDLNNNRDEEEATALGFGHEEDSDRHIDFDTESSFLSAQHRTASSLHPEDEDAPMMDDSNGNGNNLNKVVKLENMSSLLISSSSDLPSPIASSSDDQSMGWATFDDEKFKEAMTINSSPPQKEESAAIVEEQQQEQQQEQQHSSSPSQEQSSPQQSISDMQ